MRAIPLVTLTILIGFGSTGGAQQSGDAATQLKLQLMKTTQVVAVADYAGPPDKFVEDNDPNTLQIVFLAKPEYGPSRVSDDGEVIFLAPSVTEDEQSNLIGKAFDIRAQRRLANQQSK